MWGITRSPMASGRGVTMARAAPLWPSNAWSARESGAITAAPVVAKSAWWAQPITLLAWKHATTDRGSPALYAQNDSTTNTALLFDAIGGSVGGECFIDVSGNLHCTGNVAGVVAVQGGSRKAPFYVME